MMWVRARIVCHTECVVHLCFVQIEFDAVVKLQFADWPKREIGARNQAMETEGGDGLHSMQKQRIRFENHTKFYFSSLFGFSSQEMSLDVSVCCFIIR